MEDRQCVEVLNQLLLAAVEGGELVVDYTQKEGAGAG